MNIFSSSLVARDATTRGVLEGFGIDLRSITSFDALFEVLNRLDGASGAWAKIASYTLTEGVLSRPIGRFLREAANGARLQIVFDWCSHRQYGGITKALIDELSLPVVDGVVRDVRSCGTFNQSFHPKLLLIGLALPSGEELCLTVFGSANMTGSGLSGNAELGVVFAERAHPSQRSVLVWPEVHELFKGWWLHARPLTEENLTLLPCDSAELREMTETVMPASVQLRPYQNEAVKEIVQAWEDRYQKRPSTNWKGTLLVLPPATGKTLCALTAACQILKKDEGKGPVVWLSDQPLLAEQAYEEFRRTGFLQRGVIGLLVQGGQIRRSTAADDTEDNSENSLQSWLNGCEQARPVIVFTTKGDTKSLRALSFSPPRLTIVDEAHHATAPGWSEALINLQSFLVVGLTATPYRKNPESPETRELLRMFSIGSQPWLGCFMQNRQEKIRNELNGMEEPKIAYGRPVADFYDQGVTGTEQSVLSKPTFVRVRVVDKNRDQLVAVRPNGNKAKRIRFFEHPFEEDECDLRELVDDHKIVEASLAAINRDACVRAKQASMAKQTTILFARTIRHAERLRAQLEEKGVAAIALHSRDNRTRQERGCKLQQVRDVAGSVLVCVDMIAEGVDLPTADLLVMTRWTSSERLFWQMIGRGLRGPDIGGSKHVEIVTYEMQFGDSSEDSASVQTVDRILLEAFGKHAKERLAKLQIQGMAKEFDAFRGLTNGDDRASPQRRQGSMLAKDIHHREELGLDGDVFDIVIQTDSGTIVDQRPGVRQPWRVLRNIYDGGRQGRKYRFVVTGQDK